MLTFVCRVIAECSANRIMRSTCFHNTLCCRYFVSMTAQLSAYLGILQVSWKTNKREKHGKILWIVLDIRAEIYERFKTP